jgi:hypothetical protein
MGHFLNKINYFISSENKTKTLFQVWAFIFFASILDVVFTFQMLRLGIEEANPIMSAWLQIDESWAFVLAFKFFYVGLLGVAILCRQKNTRDGGTVFFNLCLLFTATVMAFVLVTHATWIYMWFF